jgi:hypothetical protein
MPPFSAIMRGAASGLLFDFAVRHLYSSRMIQPIPDKKRYQVFMDHAVPGQFEFIADFDKDSEASKHAQETHSGHLYADVIVLDAEKGILREMLPGKRTLDGTSV